MDLTKKDRIILINQYEILKRLDIENLVFYDEIIEILQNGYSIFYSNVDSMISEDLPFDEGKFVLDVLDIYRIIENYKQNNPGDVEIEGHLWGYFKGFDGNNESDYMAFTRFLIEKQGKFTEQLNYKQKTDNFNSHSPTVHKYKSMVTKWYEMNRNYSLTKEDILQILNV